MQIEFGEGPCRDSCRQHERIGRLDLTRTATAARWPRFTKAALEAGLATAAALPLRLREEVIGAVNLFHARPSGLTPQALRLGQSLSDAATIGILHQRLSQDQAGRVGQLQTALNSRIIIEQAKAPSVPTWTSHPTPRSNACGPMPAPIDCPDPAVPQRP
ncbi:GAF domain-containing protein [Streptomyces sp. cg28]|uniref:GAF domain-containing protein n=1 Tax=Streptomyces sp. cg28 TaxID=3403457 RepID=UPI003B210EFF